MAIRKRANIDLRKKKIHRKLIIERIRLITKLHH
jgi:hypothetical protein